MEYPSKAIELAVQEFQKLPGIGKKTALRLVLNLLKQREEDVKQFGRVVGQLATDVRYCQNCHNISDSNICNICRSSRRDKSVVCVVEDIRDVMAIEGTGQYQGTYHVLNGLISPVDGVGPDDLTVPRLLERVQEGEVQELIFALSATMEGDTTMFYISRQTQPHGIKISTLSRGISVGGELEYADEVTLGRSIVTRIPYQL